MTSDWSVDLRQLIFLNAAVQKAFDELPEEVRLAAELAITAIQNNRPLPPKRHAKLTGALSGVTEVRIPFNTNAYRVYHLVEHEEVVYVLDAGMKKSNEKRAIPKWQVEVLETRKKTATAHYLQNSEEYRKSFIQRKELRNRPQHSRTPGDA